MEEGATIQTKLLPTYMIKHLSKISGVAAQCRRPKNKDRGEQLTRNEAPKGDQKPPAGLGGREG